MPEGSTVGRAPRTNTQGAQQDHSQDTLAWAHGGCVVPIPANNLLGYRCQSVEPTTPAVSMALAHLGDQRLVDLSVFPNSVLVTSSNQLMPGATSATSRFLLRS